MLPSQLIIGHMDNTTTSIHPATNTMYQQQHQKQTQQPGNNCHQSSVANHPHRHHFGLRAAQSSEHIPRSSWCRNQPLK